MAIQNARILIRGGNEADFDPDKMQPREWALSTDKKIVRICVAPGVCIRMATYDAFEADMAKIEAILAECRDIQTVVNRINDEVSANAKAVAEYTEQAKQYRDEAEQFRNEAEAIVGVDVSNITSDIALNLQTLGYTKKNLLKNTAKSQTIDGIIFTVNDDGSVTADGMASKRISFTIATFKTNANEGYTLSGVPINTNGVKIVFNANAINYPSDSGSGNTFYSQEEIEAIIYIEISSGTTVSNVTFYPMIRLASITDPTYEPYVDDVDTRLKSLESGSGESGGTTGTTNYELLNNKPSINNVELSGNKTTSDLGITAESIGADAAGSASTALSDAKDYTDTKIADLVGGAPSTLDTLKEISDALAESGEVVEAINQAIGNKLDKNGDSKDNTVTFTQASTRANIASTEKHSTLFGKIAKWFSDLKSVAFSGSYDDLSNKPTIPTKTSELENDSGFMGSATALDTYEEIMANTENGKFAGAKGVKEGFVEVNNRLSKINTYVDEDGKLHFVDSEGADTVLPFSGGVETIEHSHNLEGNWVSSAQNAIYSTSLDLTSHINGRTVKNIYVDLSKSYAILCSTTNGNPGKNVSISVAYNNETNVISATWSTVSSYRGAGYYIVIQIEYE